MITEGYPPHLFRTKNKISAIEIASLLNISLTSWSIRFVFSFHIIAILGDFNCFDCKIKERSNPSLTFKFLGSFVIFFQFYRKYFNLPALCKIGIFCVNRGATNGCILWKVFGIGVLECWVWMFEKEFLPLLCVPTFAVHWPGCENIPLHLFPLSRNRGALWKCSFWDFLFPDVDGSFFIPKQFPWFIFWCYWYGNNRLKLWSK